MSHSTGYKENLSDVADVLERYSKVFERLDKITTDEDMKIIYGSLRTMSYYLSKSYLVSVNLLKEINVLYNAIEKPPRKAEYENFGRRKMNDENGK